MVLSLDVRSAAAGDRLAFARLVEATKHAVSSIALGILRDLRASEDVTQEVYLQAWHDLPTLRNADSFLPWLRQLTRHEALTYARTRSRWTKRHAPWTDDADASYPSTIERALSNEEQLVLEEALAAVPDDARDVLTLFYREEQSVKQVAALLGLSESAVKKRLERARGALRVELEGRFATVVQKTAVTSMFVASMMGSLAFAAPSTAAAATAILPKVGKGALIASLLPAALAAKIPRGTLFLFTYFLPSVALASTVVGVATVFALMHGLIKTAIDDRERRELRRFRHLGCALIAGFNFMILASVLGIPWIGDLGGGLGFLLAWLGFGVAGGILVSHRLPKLLERRRTLERETDPAAFAAAERRRRIRSYVVFVLSVGAFAAAWMLIIYRV